MEQTLGKRIVTNRKRVKLTQDQLAERLGVTAQAVSKWENDQSCPDINILPKLAEIFGISTDELLGRSYQPVHHAEVVNESAHAGNSGKSNKRGFEFNYDGGRKSAFGIAIWVLLSGGLLLAAQLLDWQVTLWDVLWPSALLIFGAFGLSPKFSFFNLGCTLFGGYFLLDNLHLLPGKLGWGILLPVCLLLFGLSLLADAFRKSRKPKFSFTYDGDNGHISGSHRGGYSVEGNTFCFDGSFGEQQQYVELPCLEHGEINTSFGEFIIDLSGVEEVSKNCCVEANCSFGELVLRVPKKYQIKADNSTTFASISFSGQPDSTPVGVLNLSAHVSFGEISVQYV